MIKLPEVRIGNLLNVVCEEDGEKVISPVLAILNNPEMICTEAGAANDTLKGVQLNHAILEACGFVQYSEDFYFLNFGDKDYTDTICIHLDSVWWWSVDTTPDLHDEGTKWREIKYLHQLQNLYYSVTGKELEVSITPLHPS